MSNTEYALCATTAAIDKYINQLDKRDDAFKYVYDKAVHLFKDQLESCDCQEDIESDLSFEIDYIIDRDSWCVDKDEVIKQIFSDYDIKEGK